MRDGKRTILSMQNHYDGPPEDFAMVVPCRSSSKRRTSRPSPTTCSSASIRWPRLGSSSTGSKTPANVEPPMTRYWRPPRWPASCGCQSVPPKVKIEAQFEVGEYEVVVLSATDSMALDTWLRAEKYNIPAGAEPMLKPYIESGMFFFVAKVNLKKVKRENGRAVLSPLRFHYDTDTFQLPVRLGLLNARGPQDLIIHILARSQRYEAANLPNVDDPHQY
jgi:hypothetical protein